MNKIISTAIISSSIISGSLFLSAVEAQAANLNGNGNGNGNGGGGSNFSAATCSTSDLPGAVACEGGFSGNDSSPLTAFTDKGYTALAWTKADKTDEGATIPNFLITSSVGQTSGNWSVNLAPGYTNQYVVAVKASNFYSLYLFNASTLSSTFTTAGVAVGNPGQFPGLSHMTLFTTSENPNNGGGQPVPEPLTILGAATAISFGAKFKQRLGKKKA